MEITNIEELEAFVPLIGDYEDIRTALEACERLNAPQFKKAIMATLEDIELCQ